MKVFFGFQVFVQMYFLEFNSLLFLFVFLQVNSAVFGIYGSVFDSAQTFVGWHECSRNGFRRIWFDIGGEQAYRLSMTVYGDRFCTVLQLRPCFSMDNALFVRLQVKGFRRPTPSQSVNAPAPLPALLYVSLQFFLLFFRSYPLSRCRYMCY